MKLNKQSVSNFKSYQVKGGSLHACQTLIPGEWVCVGDTLDTEDLGDSGRWSSVGEDKMCLCGTGTGGW